MSQLYVLDVSASCNDVAALCDGCAGLMSWVSRLHMSQLHVMGVSALCDGCLGFM